MIPSIKKLSEDLSISGSAECPFLWERGEDHANHLPAARRAQQRLRKAARKTGVHVVTGTVGPNAYAEVVPV